GRAVFAERSMQGWFVVRALGRELRLWYERRAARLGNGVALRAGLLPARGSLAPCDSAARRQLWRVAEELRSFVGQGPRAEHAFANGVGTDRTAGGGPCYGPGSHKGRLLLGDAAK